MGRPPAAGSPSPAPIPDPRRKSSAACSPAAPRQWWWCRRPAALVRRARRTIPASGALNRCDRSARADQRERSWSGRVGSSRRSDLRCPVSRSRVPTGRDTGEHPLDHQLRERIIRWRSAKGSRYPVRVILKFPMDRDNLSFGCCGHSTLSAISPFGPYSAAPGLFPFLAMTHRQTLMCHSPTNLEQPCGGDHACGCLRQPLATLRRRNNL